MANPTGLDLSQLLLFGGGWRSGKGLLNVIHLDLNASGSRSSIEPPLREDESTQLREWLRQGSGHEGDMLLLAGATRT